MVFEKFVILIVVVFLDMVFQAQSQTGPTHDKIVVCYVARWAVYRQGEGKFDIFDIEPSLCTHLIYCFVGLDETTSTIKSIDPGQDLVDNNGGGGFKLMYDLKQKHPHLKISVAIGGWNEGSAKYSKMAADPQLRRVFVTSVVNFMERHKLDGFDLFWDYPTKRGGRSEDRQNYVALVKELSDAFESKGWLLTASLRTGADDMNTVYDLLQLDIYLDFLHLMTYDYHGPWDGLAGANAPMRGRDEYDVLSVEYTVSYLLKLGVTPNKLVLTLPMYGRTYIFDQAYPNEVVFEKTPTKSIGFQGPFSKNNGFMGYNEICLDLSNKSSEWMRVWHNHTLTPYIRDDTRFITYDNPRSIAIKVKYAMDKGFIGIAAWGIESDDFRGSCDEEPDAYLDFIERFKETATSAYLRQALINFMQAQFQNEFYILSNDTPQLRLPKTVFGNYPLLRTANNAISLALEETKILNEINRIKTEMWNKLEKGSFPCVRTCSEVCFYGL